MKKNVIFSLIILLIPVKIFTDSNVPAGYKFIKPILKPLNDIKPSTPVNRCSLLPSNTATTPNWAGYVASTNVFNPTKGTVSFVQGTWKIPAIAAGQAKPGTFYAIWVGIDGLNTNTIEQLGTAYQFTGGKQINYAWYEMFPKASMQIANFPVKPGDSITASVQYLGKGVGQYKLMMLNNTRKIATVIPAAMTRSTTSPRACCEWVVEAPSLCNPSCTVLPLAHFNPATFIGCKATIKGVKGAIRNPSYQNLQLNMANNNGTIKAVTTALNSAGNGFTTTWKHN
ncbi:MAG: G1 family endopeptidase [Candidatus Babeliales bacterium]|nr:G1 family endopeptidase [Candidatus Babeliales bacterium]